MVAMYATILLGGVCCLWAGWASETAGGDGQAADTAAPAARGSGGMLLLLRTLLAVVLAVVCVGANAHARIAKRCRNGVQVVGGTVWGVLLGVAFAFAARRLPA